MIKTVLILDLGIFICGNALADDIVIKNTVPNIQITSVELTQNSKAVSLHHDVSKYVGDFNARLEFDVLIKYEDTSVAVSPGVIGEKHGRDNSGIIHFKHSGFSNGVASVSLYETNGLDFKLAGDLVANDDKYLLELSLDKFRSVYDGFFDDLFPYNYGLDSDGLSNDVIPFSSHSEADSRSSSSISSSRSSSLSAHVPMTDSSSVSSGFVHSIYIGSGIKSLKITGLNMNFVYSDLSEGLASCNLTDGYGVCGSNSDKQIISGVGSFEYKVLGVSSSINEGKCKFTFTMIDNIPVGTLCIPEKARQDFTKP